MLGHVVRPPGSKAIPKGGPLQWGRTSLPVRSDGKLDREAAVKWLADNQLGVNGSKRGANRARDLVKDQPLRVRTVAPAFAPDVVEASDMAIEMLSAILREMGPHLAAAVVDAGGSMVVAYHLDIAAAVAVSSIGERVLSERGVETGFADGYGVLEDLGLTLNVPDWPALAERAGEPFDLNAWEDAVATLPINDFDPLGNPLPPRTPA